MSCCDLSDERSRDALDRIQCSLDASASALLEWKRAMRIEPFPGTPVIPWLTRELSAGTYTLTFPSEERSTYQIKWSTDGIHWSVIDAYVEGTENETVTEWTVASGGVTRYFMIMERPRQLFPCGTYNTGWPVGRPICNLSSDPLAGLL